MNSLQMPDAQLSKIFDININWFPKELWIGNKNSFTLYTLMCVKLPIYIQPIQRKSVLKFGLSKSLPI